MFGETVETIYFQLCNRTMSDKPSIIEDIIKETINDDNIADYISDDDVDQCTLLDLSTHHKVRHVGHPASGGVKGPSRKKIIISKQEILQLKNEGKLNYIIARYWHNESELAEFRTTMNNDESSEAKFGVFQNSNIGSKISQFLDTQSIRNVKCASFFFPHIDYWRLAG